MLFAENMKKRVIISKKEFDNRFKVIPFNGKFRCYGRWDKFSFFDDGDTFDDSINNMWKQLVDFGWAIDNLGS